MDNFGRRFSVLDKCRVTTASVATSMGEHGVDQFTVTQRHFNHTSHLINIKTRLGVNTTLAPSRNAIRNERIEIQLDWVMSGDSFRRCERELTDKNIKPDTLMGMVMRAVDNRSPRNSRHNQTSAVVIIEISFQDLMEAGGTVYLEELDLMICIGEVKNAAIEHPFSANERLRVGLAASIPHLGRETFLMSIKAVDNQPLRQRQDRFILIGDEVHHIPIEMDHTLHDGVHITMRHTAAAKNDLGWNEQVQTQHLSFDEADKRFGLADSIDKARAGGNQEAVYKEKIAQRQFEQRVWEQDQKDKLLEREERLADIRHRQAQEKSHEDLKREEIKTFGDWMRITGATIAAFITLASVFAKMKPA